MNHSKLLKTVLLSITFLVSFLFFSSFSNAEYNKTESNRAIYHLTPPDHWLSDPQRPLFFKGHYNLYYLYSNPNNSPGGWRRATTEDNVSFKDQGISIPLKNNIPVWTGSTIIDKNNTAGFGLNTIIAIVTQPTGGDSYNQEQYLWYSHDDGKSFVQYGKPVIKNPDHSNWFRDPKIEWDSQKEEWVAVIGRPQSVVFYVSKNLKDWQYCSTFKYDDPNIGGMECPDFYQIKANDGSWHWVLGASVQGDYSGKVNTFAYWTGDWNGSTFSPDHSSPKWLDYGWDWYASVSWPDHNNPESQRFYIGWMNNWEYANRNIPTDTSDGYNGQMSIVRTIRLIKTADNDYLIESYPVKSLENYVNKETKIPDLVVNGSRDINYHGRSYEINLDISWDQLSNVGIQVGKSGDGQRHTDIGLFNNDTFYVNRQRSENDGYGFYPWVESHADFNPENKKINIKIFVDHQSVEVFADNGKIVFSDQVYFEKEDTGISFYSSGGKAFFKNITIKQFDK